MGLNFYNKTQLTNDLKIIVSVFGERKVVGFYTQGEFYRDELRIIDRYIVTPVLIYKNQTVDLDRLDMQSEISTAVMTLAMDANTLSRKR